MVDARYPLHSRFAKSLDRPRPNNASKYAWHYLQRIVARGLAPFDRAWMEETFETYWQARGRLITEWSNRMLLPPTPYMQEILHAADGSARPSPRISIPQVMFYDAACEVHHEHFSRTADRRVRRPKSDLELLDRFCLDGSVSAWVGNGLMTG
jgi:hypothetical protein